MPLPEFFADLGGVAGGEGLAWLVAEAAEDFFGNGLPRRNTGRSGSSSGAVCGEVAAGETAEAAAVPGVGGADEAGAGDAGGGDAGAEGVGVEAGGAGSASAGFSARRRKTGRESVSSRSRGFDSALWAALAGLLPAGSQVPAPAQVLLGPCSAPVTVNSPSEVPVRSPSYTVPDSNAMGTGAAL